jgi:diguanylate cyclase (GGDEF)-like protein
VLAEVAQRISAVLRPDDVVARLGGDEFAVLCPQLDDDSSASSIADRVVSSLRQPFFVGEVEVAIGASVGIATALSGQLTADDLIDAADRALYLAKDGGRDRWHLSSEPAPRGPLRSRS